MQAIDDKFISLDSFGVPIGVNYRGNDAYKTRLGAFFSIITFVLMFTFAVERGQKLIMREGPNITVTTETIDYENDDTTLNVHEQGVTIILQSLIKTENGVIHEIPEEYGRLVAF